MKINFISFVLLLLMFQNTQAQGCSDAGICSIGNAVEHSATKNQLEIGSVFGAGESDTQYLSPYIAYMRNFNEKWAASVKITSSVASGSFGRRGSIGDAFLTVNYKPLTTNIFKWSYTTGMKIPFNRANLKINNHPLPLDYQTSLGTFDFVGAVNLNYKKWDFNVGLQIPVFNINANSYFSEYSGTDEFPTTNLFERKPDALIRTTYTFKTKNEKFSFKPNVLFIYHLGEDTYENIYGERLSISGSDGLTINGNLISAYNFKTNTIELSLASPFVVRDIRPDGLTREWTIGIGYKTRF
ncbi:MAG: hypothetical protein PSV16_11930 [Flavobacterium sp.]|nr:hypothetical protein [Flavobacterium sp.]